MAADQFIVNRGDDKSIIAGYPWFTDWSRDAMISLPGLALATDRPEIAKSLLLNFVRYADRGMLPNRFPDQGEEPEYNTVDGTLWFFAAVDEWLRDSCDYALARERLYPVLSDIIDWHLRGTRYSIRAEADGLLHAGEEGVQLTWMDAKLGDWVVTPRSGKPVEIQALWYNALQVMRSLAEKFGEPDSSKRYGALAARARRSFNALFWNGEADCLYDVVDGADKDDSIRPNQLIALSLPHTMVARERALRILEVVERDLLTPVGLRTLSPRDPRYCSRYEGDMRSRDAAYHQGTVWPWLMGPYLFALAKFRGAGVAGVQAREWLDGFAEHLTDLCIGQVAEVFDGDPPHLAGGCPAQAWSVAELLRICRLVNKR
jgi:predicted glycogen debranching enzyme